MSFVPTTLQQRILAAVRDWEARYRTPADRYGLRHDLGIDIDALIRELGAMERAGLVRLNGKGDVSVVQTSIWRKVP